MEEYTWEARMSLKRQLLNGEIREFFGQSPKPVIENREVARDVYSLAEPSQLRTILSKI